jgi:hypothetical protein
MAYDLIYGPWSAQFLFREKWPHAKIEDARDLIHDERFEVNAPDVPDDDFFPFVIGQGLGSTSMTIQLAVMQDDESRDRVRKWLAIAEIEYPVEEEDDA